MKTILFVCVHNAGRSQMAEAFMNALAAEGGLPIRAISAGTVAAGGINPAAASVMAESGVPMTGQHPKRLTQATVDAADRVITMGCGVDADACPARILVSEDWGLDDPAGQPIETVRRIRDQIRERAQRLLDEMRERSVTQGMGRRYLSEFVGTFGIVFPPVAWSAASHLHGGAADPSAAAWVSGLAVLAMVYALGHISAAHFNPAVTLGFVAAGRFPARYAAPYVAAQVLGGVTAAGACALLFGPGYGAHAPSVRAPLVAIGTEALLAFFLMLVIISVATDSRVNEAIPGLAIGLTVVFGVIIGGPVTGGSMNPARSLGPALFAGGRALASYWIYLVGPAIGAVVAARLYEALRGGEEHARGAPNDLFQALKEVRQAASDSPARR